jgi:hypothetical protein
MTTEEWLAANLAAAPPLTQAQIDILRPICQRMAQHMENAATTGTEATPDR